MNFKQGEQIIAIKESSLASRLYPNQPVYRVGDIFTIHRESIEDSSGMTTIIWHPKLGHELNVIYSHFERLSDWREKKINSIIDTNIYNKKDETASSSL